MRVVVLGGGGFVGRHVVSTLLERKQHTVCTLSRSAGGAHSRCDHIVCDIESADALREALVAARPDVVINLIGVYAWWLPDPERFERVNVDGVRNILAALEAAATGARLVHVSTVLAYGRPTGCGLTPETAFDESTPPGPTTSRYAASKRAGDVLVEEARAKGAVGGCTLMLACCIGADDKCLDPRRDVMRFVDLIQGAIPATIAGETTFTYVHVRDAAEAIVRSAERPAEATGSFFIGEGRMLTTEYYTLIAQLCGTPAPAREVPAWLAMAGARVLSAYATYVTGEPPSAPPDLVRTATSGTLLFSARRSRDVLAMEYRPIREAFVECIDFLTEKMTGSEGAAEQAAAREPLVGS